MTSAIGAPSPGGRAGVVEVADVVDGAARVVLGGTVNDGDVRSPSPPTECEHPATSTDAATSPAIRITAKASGPTRDPCPGAAGAPGSIPPGPPPTSTPLNNRLRHRLRLHPPRPLPVSPVS